MAAAYAVLVSLSNDLELILNHPRHSFSFENNQIQSLLQIITFLIEFMESFDNSYGPSKKAALLLDRPITRAARMAEEVIESHVVNQIRSGSTLDGKRRSYFLLDVQKAIEHMEFVRRKAINITKSLKQPTYPVAAAAATASSSSTPLTSNKNSMVGSDDVLFQLLDLLTGCPSSRRVIPIVGTGGIGKTTLAKSAFEHTLIVETFDIRVWATISQVYDVKGILLTLLSPEKEPNSENIGELRVELHKKLFGRRYLIVLDDLWSVEAWDQMKLCFPDISNGSRVIVTTRQSNVADCISSSRLAMSFLDEDKSWDLFCKKTFGEYECPVELENVGKRIVKKCSGLPLAIVVVAGHLGKSSKTQEYWENVADNMSSVLTSEENKHFLEILAFSYSYLPARLKPCFIYMGTYLEDEEIYGPNLIKNWIAEGFIKTCEDKDLEEIGEDYLKDLIDRNLIFPINDEGGVISYIGIHDVLRELCIKIAKKEKLFYVVHTPRVQAICRECEGVLDGPPLVRSLIGKCGDEQSFNLRFLRILHTTLSDDEQQANLRYVEFTFFSCIQRRSPLSLLWNLQTLVVCLAESCFALTEFWEMVQLRNLEVMDYRGIYLPAPLPSDQVMQNLHTLRGVVNFKLSEEVCERIPNIKELRLQYEDTDLECLRSRSFYCLHNLGRLRKLESLSIYCSFQSDGPPYDWREGSLSLELPSSLKNLHLHSCHLGWEEITRMAGSLPRLERLDLHCISFIGPTWSLNEEEFSCLKSLRINSCDDLVYWNADRSNFPILEYLVIEGLEKLDEIPSGIGEIPTLQSINLIRCSDRLTISAARMVMESQEELGYEDLKLEFSFYDGVGQVEIFKNKLEEVGLTIGNNWLAAQGQFQMSGQMSGQVIGGQVVPVGGMEGGVWRTWLQLDSRQRIVSKIMETLTRYLPFSGQEGLQDLYKIAARFEKKIYTAATSQSDYLRMISLKMLTMETKSQNSWQINSLV